MVSTHFIMLKREYWPKWEEYGVDGMAGDLTLEHCKNYHGCETFDEWLESNPQFTFDDSTDLWDEFYELYKPY